jgi:hypothetical protein
MVHFPLPLLQHYSPWQSAVHDFLVETLAMQFRDTIDTALPRQSWPGKKALPYSIAA